MKFDFSALHLFLRFYRGETTPDSLFEHPAYQAIAHHARLFGEGLSPQDIQAALAGLPSPFYGLARLDSNLERVLALAGILQAQAQKWAAIIQNELAQVALDEDLDISIYPLIGYDMGIGLDGCACMNLNVESYLTQPDEFLYYAIHECTHVLYERRHRIPALANVVTPEQWRSYFNLWVQNEGSAVYTPLRLRTARQALQERDYRVLVDPAQLEAHRQSFLKYLDLLSQGNPLSRDEYLEICFGEKRLTYRLGCELFRRIEQTGGLEAVRAAFRLDGDEFIRRFRVLL